MKPLIFHVAARSELAEAMHWYETRSPGLGLDFLAEVERATRVLRPNPAHSPPHGKSGFRKHLVHRFPYTIFFMELPDAIWIAAVAHQKRKPGYWRGRKSQ